MSSIFTEIINRNIPADIVYEDNEIIAFKDINPQAPVHVLIVPKQQIATVNNLDKSNAAIISELFLAAQKLAVEFGVAESGYRLVMNCNGDGGQTVFHIHLHLLAGRELTWPPG